MAITLSYHTRRKGRSNRLTCYELLKLPAIRSVWLLSIVPAFLFSCLSPVETLPEQKRTQIYVTKAEKATLETLDLFFFYKEEPQRIDSYQRFSGSSVPYSVIHGGSTAGERRLAAVANYPGEKRDLEGILSFQNLSAAEVHIATEDPLHPVMTGTAFIRAGEETACSLDLRPILSRIRIHSLCCDFTGRPYEGEFLEDVRIYLTYVQAAAPLFGETGGTEWINTGGLSEQDLARLSHPEMVLRELSAPLGTEVLLPDLSLYCYPNGTEEEDLANRKTRLVIEGKLGGTTCYYPLLLDGLTRGSDQVFDFVITRMGTADPDIPANSGMITVRGRPAPWNDTDDKTEIY